MEGSADGRKQAAWPHKLSLCSSVYRLMNLGEDVTVTGKSW